jgi:hypothetical protein
MNIPLIPHFSFRKISGNLAKVDPTGTLEIVDVKITAKK